jgi:hypothetical protein
MGTIFNPVFDEKAWAELDRRSGLIDGVQGPMPDSWKYKKYAYINLELTGESATTICVADKTLKIGDTNSGNLYTTDGDNGPRRPNITLQSVNITNQGGSDYTDAYLYEIEASFKVWSLSQMNQVEKGFFRIGAEMKVSFGWRGQTEAGINTDSILASIYNFGFSMDNDGSYTCNVKAMSAAGLFGHETMGGDVRTTSTGIGKDQVNPNVTPFLSAMEVFRNLARTAFGIKKDDIDDNDGDGTPGDNEVIYKTHKDTSSGITMLFAFAELELTTTTLGFTDDSNVLYTSLGSILEYLNFTSKTDGMFKLNFLGGTTEYKLAPTENSFNMIGSSNPFSTFIPIGEAGIYGGDDKPINGAATKKGLIFNGPAEQPKWYTESGDIGKIFLNIDTVTEAYNDLQGSASGKAGAKAPPKTKDFLSKLFSMIETDTGGVVRLQTRPRNSDLDSNNKGPVVGDKKTIVDVINRAMIPTKAKDEVSKPYIFSVLGENSITRNVSLQSDFDTDLLIRASSKSIKEGSSNMKVLSGLYSDCYKNAGEPVGTGTVLAPDTSDGNIKFIEDAISGKNLVDEANTKVTYDDIKALKKEIGEMGWSSQKSNSLATIIQKYVGQNSDTIAAGSYAEVPMMLKLGVTIDGISGVKYMSPIIIDRMPTTYTGKGIDFPIISIEHSFDGQGDWSTTYETVMRIK